MKYLALFVGSLVIGSALARAEVVSGSATGLNALIPDNNLNGYQNTLFINGPYAAAIANVSVTLDLSGGFNGDLYVFLSHGTNAAVLLNRVGRGPASSSGYPDAGFGLDGSQAAFTLDDHAAHDVHLYGSYGYTLNGDGQVTGTWQPDGRFVDPLSSGTTFGAAARNHLLSGFNGMDYTGAWTLFVADAAGGSESVLNSWGVQITLVPEPSAAALLAAGAATLLLTRKPFGSSQTRRRRCPASTKP